MNQQTGKILILTGVAIVLIGILVYFFHQYFRWLGRLPGDIRVEKENFRFYFPITTMIIVSVVLTMIIAFIKKLW